MDGESTVTLIVLTTASFLSSDRLPPNTRTPIDADQQALEHHPHTTTPRHTPFRLAHTHHEPAAGGPCVSLPTSWPLGHETTTKAVTDRVRR